MPLGWKERIEVVNASKHLDKPMVDWMHGEENLGNNNPHANKLDKAALIFVAAQCDHGQVADTADISSHDFQKSVCGTSMVSMVHLFSKQHTMTASNFRTVNRDDPKQ